MKITSAKDLVDKVLKDIETLTPEETKSRIEKENAILIDIRDIRELWREGTIENCKHIPRGMLEFWVDPESPYSKNDIPMDKNLILFCAQGMRSALATRSLKEMGFPKVSHVRGGFGALKDKGFKVVEVKKK
jgi:rhodanese-related sulfurtransferase